MSSLLIKNISSLYQVREQPLLSVSGAEMSVLPALTNAWLLAENGKIASYGTMDTCPERADEVLDAKGGSVLPSWSDSHTHIVYAGSREQEFLWKIKGMTYEQIAEQGGGILNSAARLAQTSEDELFESAYQRLMEIIGFGTGALEIKSGYGLSTETELKMLKVVRRLKENSPIPIKATFLGAHAIPAVYKQNRDSYISLVVNEMIPKIAGEGLADYCDVFCDKGFFTVQETDIILKAADKAGIKAKLHANELACSGGVQVGVANNAISVDHLEFMGEAEVQALKGSNTMPTLLPSTAFFLNLEFAPARFLIDSGLPVALATDYNPGSSPSGNMPFVISLACIKMKMTPEEAINAATINGAYAMECKNHGSITVGNQANLILTKQIPSLAYIPYSFGSDLIDKIVLNGKIWA